MTSMVEVLGGRTVGTVESVTAGAVSVLVDPDAPQATALNTGSVMPFPRINGYLLIPNESGAMVGIVTAIRVERAPYPKRRGMQDFGLVDLPFPGRLLTLTPLGTLLAKPTPEGNGALRFEVRRGVDVFPSVGDQALLPTDAQLRAIVEGENAERTKRLWVGTCPTAASSDVYVDPDKLFGRHVAVLGNTGAGKSCTVAGLIRWSLSSATKALEAGHGGGSANARFIVLDPNGEYAKAFSDLGCRVFKVDGLDGSLPLKVPAWLWDGEEWVAFSGAAPGVQRPILLDALRRLRAGGGAPDTAQTKVRGRVKRYRIALRLTIASGDHQVAGKREGVAKTLVHLAEDLEDTLQLFPEGAPIRDSIAAVVDSSREAEEAARSGPKGQGEGYWHSSFPEVRLAQLAEALKAVSDELGLVDDDTTLGEDVPVYFSARDLPEFVEALAVDAPGRDVSQFVDSLNLRIRGLFAAGALSSVADPGPTPTTTLGDWLASYIGAKDAANGPIAVLDLSLVPSEAVHVVVAVLGRLVFEAVQRHRKMAGSELPTVLVLEEAHTFVHKDLTADGAPPAGKLCCRTFERIAREGRKFGLGLLLASQRPSEVSPTVLSQCNTFLLHRIVNDRDQDLVKRLVPDGLGDLLRELPSLPSGRAILLGWAAPAPLLVEIRHLPEAERPHSPDPAFWKVWTRQQACDIDWDAVSAAWQQRTAAAGAAEADTAQSPEGGAPGPPASAQG